MFGSQIRDKDGVAATVTWNNLISPGFPADEYLQLVFAELVASLNSEGKTVKSYLQELYTRYIQLTRITSLIGIEILQIEVMATSR